jgi:hypothetical protein
VGFENIEKAQSMTVVGTATNIFNLSFFASLFRAVKKEPKESRTILSASTLTFRAELM